MPEREISRTFRGLGYEIVEGLTCKNDEAILSIRPMGSFVEITFKGDSPDQNFIELRQWQNGVLYKVLVYTTTRKWDYEERDIEETHPLNAQ